MSKKEKLKVSRVDLDANLEIPEFDFDAPPPKDDRKPVTKFAAGVISGAKNTLLSGDFIKGAIKRTLPEGYGEAIDLGDRVKDETKKLYNNAVNQIKPSINEMAKAGSKLLPAEKAKSKAALDSVAKWAKDNASKYTSDNKDQQREAGMSMAMADVFKFQAEQNIKAGSDQNVKDNIRTSLEISRHKDTFGLLNSINLGVTRLAQYQEKITAAYQKKSLELQYRGYFVAMDVLEESKRQNAVTTRHLQDITKNTALPESVKTTQHDTFRDVARNKFWSSVNDGLFGGRNDIVGKMSKKIGDTLKDKLTSVSDAFSAAAMGMEQAQQVSEMGAGGPSGAESAGDIAGGMGLEYLAGKAGKKGREYLEKNKKISSIGRQVSGAVNNLPQHLNELKRSNKGEDNFDDTKLKKAGNWLLRAFKSIIPDQEINTSTETDKVQKLTDPFIYTKQTHKSINEVIPGFLARIFRELQVLRTGDTKIGISSYDYNKNKFSSFKESAKSNFSQLVNTTTTAGDKTHVESVLNEIDPKQKLSADARAALSKKLAEDLKDGKPLDIKKLMSKYSYQDEKSQPHAGAISKHVQEHFKLNDKGEEINSEDLDTRERNASIKSKYSHAGGTITQNELNDILKEIDPNNKLDDKARKALGRKLLGDNMDTRLGSASRLVNQDTYKGEETKEYAKLFAEIFKEYFKTDDQGKLLDKDNLDDQNRGNQFTSKYNKLGTSMNDSRGMIQQMINTGQGDFLRTTGLVNEDLTSINLKRLQELHTGGTFEPKEDEVAPNAVNSTGSDALLKVNTEGFAKLAGLLEEIRDSVKKDDSTAVSDIEAKKDFKPVSGDFALNAVRNTPVTNWNYKLGKGDGGNHIGPMAQTVQKTMGNDAAPGGKKLDLVTMNGMTMSALQELDKQQQALTQSYRLKPESSLGSDESLLIKTIKSIGKQTVDKLEEIKKAIGSGMGGGGGKYSNDGSLSGSIANIAGAGIRGTGSLIKSGFGLGNKIAGSIPSLVNKATGAAAWGLSGIKTGAEFGLDKLRNLTKVRDVFISGEVEPRIEVAKLRAGKYFMQMSDGTMKAIKDISEIKGRIVDEFGETVIGADELGKMFTKNIKGRGFIKIMTSIAGKTISFGNKVSKSILNLIPPALRSMAEMAKAVSNGIIRLIDEPVDIYVTGTELPVMLARIMRTGGYISKRTQKVITRPGEIDGTVLNTEGNVVLSEEDLKKGIYDKNGKPIKTPFEKVKDHLFGVAKKAIDVMKSSGKMALNIAKGGIKHIGNLATGGINGLMGGINGVGGGLGNKESNSLLKQIRDILDSRLPTSKKKRYNDADGDGNREGSWRTMGKKKKDKEGNLIAAKDGAKDKGDGHVNTFDLIAEKAQAAKDGLKDLAGGALDAFGNWRSGRNAPTGQPHPGTVGPKPKGRLGRMASGIGNLFRRGAPALATGAALAAPAVAAHQLAGPAPALVGPVHPNSIAAHQLAGQPVAPAGPSNLARATDAANNAGLAGDAAGAAGKVGRFGKIGKLAAGVGKFAGKWLPGVGLALGAASAYSNVKQGNYGEAALDAGMGLGSLALGGGTTAAAAGTLGAAGTVAGGAAAAGTAATAAGAAGVGGAAAAGGGLLAGLGALIASPVILGALAVGAIGAIGYFGYKYATRNSASKLELVRYAQYGFNPENKEFISKVFGLEDMIFEKNVVYDSGKARLTDKNFDIEKAMKIFDVSKDDEKAYNDWIAWFTGRFKAVYLTHLTGLFSINPKLKLSEINDLKPDEKLKYLSIISFENGPYNVTYSPIKDLPSLTAGPAEVTAAIEAAKEEINKNIKPKDGKSVGALGGAVALTATEAALVKGDKEKAEAEGRTYSPDDKENMYNPKKKSVSPIDDVKDQALDKKMPLIGIMGAAGGIGLLGGPVAIGALAAAAVGYTLYKRSTKKTSKLTSLRFVQYGFKPELQKQADAVFGLEDLLVKNVVYDTSGAKLTDKNFDINEALKLFGITPDDEENYNNWIAWFTGRFKPVYLTHLTALNTITPKTPVNGADDLEAGDKMKYLNLVKYDDGPYDVTYSPITGIKDLNANADDVKTAFDLAKQEVEAKVKSDKTSIIGSATKSLNALSGTKDEAPGETNISDDVKKDSGFFSNVKDILGDALGLAKAVGNVIATPLKIMGSAIGRFFGFNATPLETVRFKTYGLKTLDRSKVVTLRNLEERVFKDVKYNSSGTAEWSNTAEFIIRYVGKDFGVEGTTSELANDWITWFTKRFLPVYLTYLGLMKQATGKEDPSAGALALKPSQQFDIGTKISAVSGVWDVKASPWQGYELLTDIAQIKDNLALLRQASERDEMVEAKGKSDGTSKSSINSQTAASAAAPDAKPKPVDAAGTKPTDKPTAGPDGEGKTLDASGKSSTIAKQSSGGSGNPKLAGGPLSDGRNASQYMKLGPGVSLNGLNPEMLKNFNGMVEEYGTVTGNTTYVTSGVRSYEQQMALYKKDPSKAAKPGGSPHEFGLALDVSSSTLDDLDKLGLMKKYGFTRPVGGETWHMEAAGLGPNMAKAKTDPGYASKLMTASVGRGGGGVGSVKGSPLGHRNAELAQQLYDASGTTVTAAKDPGKTDSTGATANASPLPDTTAGGGRGVGYVDSVKPTDTASVAPASQGKVEDFKAVKTAATKTTAPAANLPSQPPPALPSASAGPVGTPDSLSDGESVVASGGDSNLPPPVEKKLATTSVLFPATAPGPMGFNTSQQSAQPKQDSRYDMNNAMSGVGDTLKQSLTVQNQIYGVLKDILSGINPSTIANAIQGKKAEQDPKSTTPVDSNSGNSATTRSDVTRFGSRDTKPVPVSMSRTQV